MNSSTAEKINSAATMHRAKFVHQLKMINSIKCGTTSGPALVHFPYILLPAGCVTRCEGRHMFQDSFERHTVYEAKHSLFKKNTQANDNQSFTYIRQWTLRNLDDVRKLPVDSIIQNTAVSFGAITSVTHLKNKGNMRRRYHRMSLNQTKVCAISQIY